jgi:hypothetical protein
MERETFEAILSGLLDSLRQPGKRQDVERRIESIAFGKSEKAIGDAAHGLTRQTGQFLPLPDPDFVPPCM